MSDSTSHVDTPATNPEHADSDEAGKLALAWAWCIVDEIVRAGVRHIALSPGSRSTPLALAAARCEAGGKLQLSIHYDERSAGFFALGHAKASGAPAAVICTSGTAAANFLPAVIEADADRTPLLVLTADRPPELRDTGAWQAIDQLKLYGRFTRWFAEMATPDRALLPDYPRSVAARAVFEAAAEPSGPVHLNIPFREPLVPGGDIWRGDGESPPEVGKGLTGADELPAERGERLPEAARGFGAVGVAERSWGSPGSQPPPADESQPADPGEFQAAVVGEAPPAVSGGRAARGSRIGGREVVQEAAQQMAAAERGLIVVGRGAAPPGSEGELLEAIRALSGMAGFPVIVEAASGLRFRSVSAIREGVGQSEPRRENVPGEPPWVAGADAFLRAPDWGRRHRPDLVIRFGGSPVWKHVSAYLAGDRQTRHIAVDPRRTWDDPHRAGGLRLVAPAADTANWLAEVMPTGRRSSSRRAAASEEWRSAWRTADAAVAGALERALAEEGRGGSGAGDGDPGGVASSGELSSLWIPEAVLDAVDEGGALFVANSMAIRDVESFTRLRSKDVLVITNRGASGIDGTASTALGMAAGAGHAGGASSSGVVGPAVALTGDLALLHDVNGLAAISAVKRPIVVVCVNDGGGGIFDYLPYATLPQFDRLFRTPSGVDLERVAGAFGLRHQLVRAASELTAAIRGAPDVGHAVMLEVRVDAEANAAAHRRFWAEVARRLE